MPTYDYECLDCSHRFESNHSISADSPPCPACRGAVKQLFLQAPVMHSEATRGRELAIQSLNNRPASPNPHGPGCSCCKSV
ncbi:FmdB family zinc ribbon protein [Thiohalomonas denitrificans]|uniref:FmdB family zinc ribbon protein n=1 Tax=Thiohalomonas denitrificans TaxID=415747 RepID=UPI0039836484